MIERINLLISTLRSGEYNQGTGCLRSNDKFCCLGVACEVYQKEFGDLKMGDYSYDYSTALMPDKVRDYFGFSDNSGSFENGSLIDLNDVENYSFEEIADVIESRPPGLFEDE